MPPHITNLGAWHMSVQFDDRLWHAVPGAVRVRQTMPWRAVFGRGPVVRLLMPCNGPHARTLAGLPMRECSPYPAKNTRIRAPKARRPAAGRQISMNPPRMAPGGESAGVPARRARLQTQARLEDGVQERCRDNAIACTLTAAASGPNAASHGGWQRAALA